MYFNHGLWGEVVPDGPDYCHWGGRVQSRSVLNLLGITSGDRVLEICCGRGGTLQHLAETRFVFGIDLSGEALQWAKQKELAVAQANALRLPFKNGVFTKILSQDADAWMYNKEHLAQELHRVAKDRCKLVIQTYARSEMMPADLVNMTNSFLKRCGYSEHELPVVERVSAILEMSGWHVEQNTSLHSLYTADNEQMIRRLKRSKEAIETRYRRSDVVAVEKLLRHERFLFRNHFWTGMLLVARAKK